ncbi:MAG: alcohol dehydrogenase catalytic domain-containing protein, partial [Cyanobacteria bacterium]|nr:alcohol dehydrogenase catalytic domain-containing protein [Cyanobacteriota bacterium]
LPQNTCIPEINENEALLKVHAAAICGTDLRVITSGHRHIQENETRILGHEVAGIISKVGEKVKGLKKGMRVAVAPVSGCGVCRQCISGMQVFCGKDIVLGLSTNGGFAEYMIIPEPHIKGGNVFILPDNMSFEVAAIAEPLATVFTGLSACEVKPADVILVIGAGPVGLMHMQMAKIFGAQKVIVSEILDERREIALKFGADRVVNPLKEDLKEIIFNLSYGRGADAIIIAAASAEAQSQSLDLVAIGGHINFFGTLPKGKDKVVIESNKIHYKNIKILGTTGSTVLNYYKTLELLLSNKIDLSKFISSKFNLDQYHEAFETAKSTSSLKVIFKI